MKKAFFLGIAGAFFFAFTFILNRSMHLSGGNWIFSASLRYLFTLPLMAFLVRKRHGFQNIHKVIRKKMKKWLIWSTVGFGLFYAPLSFAGDYGESWLIAASWQLTIVMGVLLSPLFQKKIPVKNLMASGVILSGVFLLQLNNIISTNIMSFIAIILPIGIAAISYPLGNRKIMEVSDNQISTIERTYGMTLCSMPFWVALAIIGIVKIGIPSANQCIQSFGVAVFSGVIATLLFFKATDLVKKNIKHLAVIESTQSGEVVFTLIGGIILLGDRMPELTGIIGLVLIVGGMIFNSMLAVKD